ncbi:TPA: hypothetical protein UMV35_002315 [Stenotrophomonas maltophilia]|uniref:hypothetical protein n=1 Tax=Stenotrophomonas maltophilia TaxID=40324 RepID=UPI0006ACA04F|nr:hypothetical protein [Stenotrophomonas maltophilia]KOQ70510.1 hypothetical protein ABW43_05400 [Stenotrophomonas maltophilia]HEL3750018.1 hypothetical protein [Stenotrophomonas maltophilia]HEL7728537.1 hypothetical protein [Stenotrophomonas maltophilia]
MKILVNQLDFEVPNASGPDYSGSLARVFPEVPERWVFGGSAASLVSNKGRTLTYAGTAPTFDANRVTVPEEVGAGLITPFADSASFTEVFAFARGSTSTMFVAGSVGNDGGVNRGDGIVTNGQNIRSLAVGFSNADVAIPTVSSTTMVVVGVSFSGSSRRVVVHGGGTPIDAEGTKTVRQGVKRMIGNNGYSTSGYVRAVSFAEYQYLPRPSSLDELTAAVNEMAARVAARGLVVL